MLDEKYRKACSQLPRNREKKQKTRQLADLQKAPERSEWFFEN
jgi:hypothetical protein